MGKYQATVEWRAEGDFKSNRYSRAHQWRFDGGAVVPASSSPYVVPVPLSDPAAVDPEEAVIAAAASCHMLWFLSLARDAGLEVLAYRDTASGKLGKDERGKTAITEITLMPEIEFAGPTPDEQQMARLHGEAHDKCFIANSLRGRIIVGNL